MSGPEVAMVIGATAGAISSILGGVAIINAPVKKKLEQMEADRKSDERKRVDSDEENAQVHRTIVCGQLAIIKALRTMNPKINGKVAEFEKKYEHMLEYDCPPPKPAP